MTVNTASTPVKNRANFTPPPVKLGEIVLWFARGIAQGKPLPALVIFDNGNGNLCLHIFDPGGPYSHDGVRHHDDPSLSIRAREIRGCWVKNTRR